MKISKLIDNLQKIKDDSGDLDVFLVDPNSNYGPFEVTSSVVVNIDEGDYPKEYNMPLIFVELNNL